MLLSTRPMHIICFEHANACLFKKNGFMHNNTCTFNFLDRVQKLQFPSCAPDQTAKSIELVSASASASVSAPPATKPAHVPTYALKQWADSATARRAPRPAALFPAGVAAAQVRAEDEEEESACVQEEEEAPVDMRHSQGVVHKRLAGVDFADAHARTS